MKIGKTCHGEVAHFIRFATDLSFMLRNCYGLVGVMNFGLNTTLIKENPVASTLTNKIPFSVHDVGSNDIVGEADVDL